MERRKRSTADAHPPELSADIVLFQILPRLPVKSVLRFRCVSKEWHSFLTSPAFVKMHLHHAIPDNKMVIVSRETPNTSRSIDCERPGRPFPFKVEPGQGIRIFTCVHGLLCIGIRNNKSYGEHSDLIIWNPATGDYKTLTKPVAFSHMTDESLFGLYHSSCDQDYKLLHVTRDANIVYIYSLKSDSWRKVESGFKCTGSRRTDNWVSHNWGPSVWLNENLYFVEHFLDAPYSIMRFNTKTETLEGIAPPYFLGGKTIWLSFTVDQKRNGCIELWNNFQNPVTLSSPENVLLWKMDVDGEADFTEVENSYKIFSDIDIIQSHQIDMKPNTQDLCSYIKEKLLVWPGGGYIETLVSPNLYTK